MRICYVLLLVQWSLQVLPARVNNCTWVPYTVVLKSEGIVLIVQGNLHTFTITVRTRKKKAVALIEAVRHVHITRRKNLGKQLNCNT